MKRLSLFLVLLLHLNFCVFIPQLDEKDSVSKSGAKIDDINSLTEFIDQIVLGHKDSTPEDEDNDQARNYHVIKTLKYTCQEVVLMQSPLRKLRDVTPVYKNMEEKITSIYFEIPSPPPKA